MGVSIFSINQCSSWSIDSVYIYQLSSVFCSLPFSKMRYSRELPISSRSWRKRRVIAQWRIATLKLKKKKWQNRRRKWTRSRRPCSPISTISRPTGTPWRPNSTMWRRKRSNFCRRTGSWTTRLAVWSRNSTRSGNVTWMNWRYGIFDWLIDWLLLYLVLIYFDARFWSSAFFILF